MRMQTRRTDTRMPRGARRRGSVRPVPGRPDGVMVGTPRYLFTQGKHSSGLDYRNLLFISQILKHKNGHGRWTPDPTDSQR